MTERDYDGLGRLIEERWKDGANTVTTIEFGYDVASQLGTADDDFSGYPRWREPCLLRARSGRLSRTRAASQNRSGVTA